MNDEDLITDLRNEIEDLKRPIEDLRDELYRIRSAADDAVDTLRRVLK